VFFTLIAIPLVVLVEDLALVELLEAVVDAHIWHLVHLDVILAFLLVDSLSRLHA